MELRDHVIDIIHNFKDHPSNVIIIPKDGMDVKDKFSFLLVNEDIMKNEIKNLNINKPRTYNNIPAKILVDNVDICIPYNTKIYIDDSVVG